MQIDFELWHNMENNGLNKAVEAVESRPEEYWILETSTIRSATWNRPGISSFAKARIGLMREESFGSNVMKRRLEWSWRYENLEGILVRIAIRRYDRVDVSYIRRRACRQCASGWLRESNRRWKSSVVTSADLLFRWSLKLMLVGSKHEGSGCWNTTGFWI